MFIGAKVVVFVDGDFWHGRDWPELRTKLMRRANPEYWVEKIRYNRERDKRNDAQLGEQGWKVFRLWETDVLEDPEAAALSVEKAVKASLSEPEPPLGVPEKTRSPHCYG